MIETGNSTIWWYRAHHRRQQRQTTLNANITVNGDTTHSNGVKYDADTGTVTIERALTAVQDSTTAEWSQAGAPMALVSQASASQGSLQQHQPEPHPRGVKTAWCRQLL